MRRSLLSLITLAGIAVSGCGTLQPYSVPSLAAGEGAVVYGTQSQRNDLRPPVVRINAIDSWEVPSSRQADAIRVGPGMRVLNVTGTCFRGWKMDVAEAELRVPLEAGGTYEIQVAQADGGLAFSVRDIGSRRLVSSAVATVSQTILMPPTAEKLAFR